MRAATTAILDAYSDLAKAFTDYAECDLPSVHMARASATSDPDARAAHMRAFAASAGIPMGVFA
ncbi:hypothetical protein ATJ88_2869 [Isoptericola jiangsuensis]|uniref:Uncharacterized protein n=2 Tax=Isoptericola jiangsuensis TaxID=548579 RepID=A0A2A9F045_9MICO|nr:hypothetical protein ATJ88_2869 [Isoptericola jiangsuensis]